MSPYEISGFLKHWNLSMIEQLGLSIYREQSPLISSHQQNPHFTPTTNLRVVSRNDVKQNTSTCLLAQAAKRQDGPDGPFAINQAMIKMERHEIESMDKDNLGCGWQGFNSLIWSSVLQQRPLLFRLFVHMQNQKKLTQKKLTKKKTLKARDMSNGTQ